MGVRTRLAHEGLLCYAVAPFTGHRRTSMGAKTDRSLVCEGCIRVPEDIKGECHRINEPIRVSFSRQRRNIFTIEKPIIIKTQEPIQAGALVQVVFDLTSLSRHRFGDAVFSPRERFLIGIGQVFKTIKAGKRGFRIFIRPLEFHLAKDHMIGEQESWLAHPRPDSRFSR